MSVVFLAGGTGGAKLARGLLDELGPDLIVIANTGDDLEIYGAYVSPDPDLVTFWLADAIDERGWGLEDDTFAAMDQLRALGEDVWFNLGDRDLAIGLHRAGRLAGGARLTEAIDDLRRAFGVPGAGARPERRPLRTHVQAGGRWRAFQEFMIRPRGGPDRGRRVPRRRPRSRRPRPSRRCATRARSSSARRTPCSRSTRSWPSGTRGAPRAEAPVVAVSPLVRGAGPEGADGRVPALGRAAARLRRDRRPLRRADRRPRRRPARRARPDAGDRRRAQRPRVAPPRGARGARVRRRASVTAGCGPSRSCPSSRFGRAKQRLTGGLAPDQSRAGRGDGRRRARRARARAGARRADRRHRGAGRASAPRGYGARVVHDPVEAGQSRGRALGHRRRASRRRRACCSSPATARRSTRPRSSALLRASSRRRRS